MCGTKVAVEIVRLEVVFQRQSHIRLANLPSCSLSSAKKQTRLFWETGYALCYSFNKYQNIIHYLEQFGSLSCLT